MTKAKRTKIKFPADVWILVAPTEQNPNGEILGMYDTEEEAYDDCWGPNLWDARVVQYTRDTSARPRLGRHGMPEKAQKTTDGGGSKAKDSI